MRLALVLLCLPCGTALAQGTPLEHARKQYDLVQSQPWFEGHTNARNWLASTRTKAAFEILVRDYAKKPLFGEHVRHTIGAMLGWHYSEPGWAEALEKLRARHRQPEDFWLWASTLRAPLQSLSPGEIAERATSQRRSHLGLAHVVALSRGASGQLYAAVPELLQRLPKRRRERGALLGGIACALGRQHTPARSEPALGAIRAWIDLLDRDGFDDAADRRLVRRALRVLLGVSVDHDEGQPWRQLLEQEAAAPATGPTRSRPRFFGLESDGRRVLFLIDTSDSMARRVQHGRKASRTGDRRRQRSAALDESDIPWGRVKSRYDLAREHLTISLLRLDPKLEFAVVVFGKRVDTLAATRGFVPANDRNVGAAIRELEGMGPRRVVEVGEQEAGAFRGTTNLHGALWLGMELMQGGRRSKDPALDERARLSGADTIFVLSDGAPTWDGFERAGISLHDYRGTGEFGGIGKGQPITYCGPYRQPHWLLEDVRRMNALRLVRIFCVGIGEAQMGLLENLARQNFGKAVRYRLGG